MILNWVERNFSCPMCRAEVENFVPVRGQTLEPRFTELWEEHFLTNSEEPAPQPEPTKKGDVTTSKAAPSTQEEVTIPIPVDLDEEELALLFEEPAPLEKKKDEDMLPLSFEPYSRTFHPQFPVLATSPVLVTLEGVSPMTGFQTSPTIVRLPNMTVPGALVLHTLTQQNYQIPHQLKRAHARTHLQTKMQALNRVQRRPLSTPVNVRRVKPIRMDLAFRLPAPPKAPVSLPPQPVLRQQAKTNVVNASKKQVLRKVHTKLAILAKRV